MDESWDLQLERWLSGSMSSEESQAFLQRTTADSECLARMGRVLRQQALIAEHLGAVPAVAQRPHPHRRQWQAWGWSAAAAACIAMVMGWWGLAGEATMARVRASGGELPQIERDGRPLDTTVLISGDLVRTGSTRAQLEIPGEATVIICAPRTELRLDAHLHERQITVRHGRIDATIAPQPADRPMVFGTAEARVTVVGTQLSVIADIGATAVAVQHGTVRVAGSSSSDVLVVTAGQSAHVNAGQAPVAQPLTSGWEVNQGLVGYWPLDEGTGSVAHDVSGHGHHSHSLTAAWVTGRPGGSPSALAFTGQFGGEWADFGQQDLGTPEGITVSAWVKTSLPRFGTVFSGGFTVGSGASIIGIKESERPGADDAAGFVNFLAQSNHPDERLDSPQRITDDRWHHLAWSWSSDGWRHIWIDGVQAGARQDASERDRRWNAWYWAIGAASDRLVWNFAGAITEVRVYNRALQADEIARLAGTGSGAWTP